MAASNNTLSAQEKEAKVREFEYRLSKVEEAMNKIAEVIQSLAVAETVREAQQAKIADHEARLRGIEATLGKTSYLHDLGGRAVAGGIGLMVAITLAKVGLFV